MKRCPDLKYEPVFLQMARISREHPETCFGGKMRDTFVYCRTLKLDLNKASHFV